MLIAGALLVALVAAQQASGPQRNGGNGGPVPKKSTPSAGTARPSVAVGNNIVQVIDSLVAAGAAKGKGEYETTEEYESRQKAVAARYGQFTFSLPSRITTFKYDADAGEMTVSLLADCLYLNEQPDGYGKPASLLIKQRQSQTGVAHGIIVDPSSPILASLKSKDVDLFLEYTFSFPLDAVTARRLKPSLVALAVGKLAEARVYKGEEAFGAKIRSKRQGLFVRLLVEEVRIIDLQSGAPVKIIR